MRLSSVELNVLHPKAAHAFMMETWGMADAPSGAHEECLYLRGSSELPYLVALRPSETPSVASLTFLCEPGEVAALSERAMQHGAKVQKVASDDLGGGEGVLVQGPEGEVFRFLEGVAMAQPITGRDLPVKLTHVVFNATDAEATADFVEAALGFKVSDRTKGMVFVRCNRSHHSIAFARAGFASLNHIAFEMQDMDAVMRGIGRMRDVGAAPAWGPGRHGPGANVFAYFIAPFGPVIEFSTAVDIVGDDYKVGAPEDWTWPEKRIDQWGLSDKDVKALGEAERRFKFATDAFA